MKVAYTSPFVPVEWIAAHGLTPMRVRPKGLPANLRQGQCPFARAFVEELPSLGARAAIFTTTCDQMRRAPETLAASEMPVFLMNVPVTWQGPAAGRMYVQELQRLGKFFVALGGQSPTAAHLAEIMSDYEQARQRVVAEAEKGDRHLLPNDGKRSQSPFSESPFSARRFQESLMELHQLPYDRVPWLRRVQPREDVVANAATTAPSSGIPIAVIGGPLTAAGLELLDVIEAAGGRVVVDGTETGLRGLPAPIDRRHLAADPLAELAAIYFGGIGDAFRRPNTLLYEWLGKHIQERRPRGIVLIHQVWCDLWHAELARLREWSPLSVLQITDDGSPSARASATTRIQSFLEMLR